MGTSDLKLKKKKKIREKQAETQKFLPVFKALNL